MTRKEKIDLLLSKVEADKKEAFIADLREAKTMEERLEVIKKYGITLTGEEEEALKNKEGNELSDEELDEVAGGCNPGSCSPCSRSAPND